MWKIALLFVSFYSPAIADIKGPIVWGKNNSALYLPLNRPNIGYQCLAIDAQGNITPQACSGGGAGNASPQTFANVNSSQTLNPSIQNYYADVSSGSINLTLPPASSNNGVLIEVMNTTFNSANVVTVIGTINGTVNEILGSGENSVYKSNGIEWKKKN